MEMLLAFVVLGAIFFGGRALFRHMNTREGRPHVARGAGPVLLRRSRKLGALLALGALAPAGLIAYIAVQAWEAGPEARAGALAGTALAALVGAFAVLELVAAFRRHVAVSEEGLLRVGVFTRRRVAWGDVVRLAYNPGRRWFFLTTRDRRHLWLEVDVDGMGDFAAIALERLAPQTLSAEPMAEEALELLAHAARRG
jgi:hypothetical protein